MNSLARRPRIRRVVESAARRALYAVGATAPEPEQPHEPVAPAPAEAKAPPPDLSRDLPAGVFAVEPDAATTLLYRRLDDADIAEIEQRVLSEAEPRELFEQASPAARRFLALTYGVWFGIPAVLEKTGLTPGQPPDEIHAMARGPLAAAGGLYEADLVVDALASAGVQMSEVSSALDFGCSSGRVLRVMNAAYPEVSWRGCDPNEPAIEWALANLPGIELSVSDQEPPLALEDGALDLAYAISIWSHFEPGLGLRWFEEMHRVIRPGGHLVCTTHGFWTVAHDAARGLRSPELSQEVCQALYRQGTWYHPEFGDEGDWGVVNPSWGTAFLSPEWMLAQLCPRWRVVEFAPGRNQGNQDLYVLERA